MPSRKHHLLIDRGRRFLDRSAYDRLLHAYPGVLETAATRRPWTSSPDSLTLSRVLPRAWRRDMERAVSLLPALGIEGVTLRTFRSRKHARRGHSKLHAVMQAPNIPVPPQVPVARMAVPSSLQQWAASVRATPSPTAVHTATDWFLDDELAGTAVNVNPSTGQPVGRQRR